MISKTISVDYALIESGLRSRRALFSDTVGIIVNNPFNWNEQALINTRVINLTNITSFIYIKTDQKLTVVINGSNPGLIVTNFLLVSAAANSVNITNNSGNTANIIVSYF